jgi:hypothetical protein
MPVVVVLLFVALILSFICLDKHTCGCRLRSEPLAYPLSQLLSSGSCFWVTVIMHKHAIMQDGFPTFRMFLMNFDDQNRQYGAIR